MKLTVSNFRNIDNCCFNIIDNRLILVGKNGVGKSNVLSAIYKGKYTFSKAREYEDVLYIDPELSIDDDEVFEKDSIFIQLISIIYNTDDDQTRYKYLLEEINDLLQPHNYSANIEINKLEDNYKSVFYKYCNKLASGLKRDLLYKFLYKIATSNNDKKIIILIDSPEVYAHPSMIRSMCNELKFLAEKGHLVIVSTHNAKVVETLSTDIRQISKLTLSDYKLKSYQIDIDNYTSKLRKFYDSKNIFYLPNGRVNEALVHIVKNNLESFCKSFLRESVLKILFTDYVLLGEGSSEEVLFHYIFTRMDYRTIKYFSDYNIDYVTGFGKFYMPFYFILANLYNIKVICVYDVDKLENKSHRAFYNAFSYYELNNKDVFTTIKMDPDLENELKIIQSKHRVEKPLNIFNEVFYRNNNVNNIVIKIKNAINDLNNDNIN
ncbi:MAG: ATP-dependent nuclease [Bacilli bacterium]